MQHVAPLRGPAPSSPCHHHAPLPAPFLRQEDTQYTVDYAITKGQLMVALQMHQVMLWLAQLPVIFVVGTAHHLDCEWLLAVHMSRISIISSTPCFLVQRLLL